MDHAYHAGHAFKALDETITLLEEVRTAVQTAPEDPLIVVTSDHSHILNVVGMSGTRQPNMGEGAWYQWRVRRPYSIRT